MEERGSQCSGIHTHVREDVGYFEEVTKVRIAGTADLIAMAFGGDFIGAANHPGIFRGTIFAQFFEEFFEARVELPLVAVAVEIQREVAGGRHTLVYLFNVAGEKIGKPGNWKALPHVSRDEAAPYKGWRGDRDARTRPSRRRVAVGRRAFA